MYETPVYPMFIDDSGNFITTKDPELELKSGLYQLLGTSIGEREMSPTFGTNLYSFFFMNVGDESRKALMIDEVKTKISLWFPEVIVSDVFLDLNDDKESFTGTIYYESPYAETEQTMSF